MQRIFAPHTPATQGLPTNPGLWVTGESLSKTACFCCQKSNGETLEKLDPAWHSHRYPGTGSAATECYRHRDLSMTVWSKARVQ